MRTILAAYLNTTPRELAFSYARKGKPELAPDFSGARLRFNLAHSRDHALLAVTRGLSVGIDIEFIDSRRGG
jgi:4'-phosphopantetheinyl transferase